MLTVSSIKKRAMSAFFYWDDIHLFSALRRLSC